MKINIQTYVKIWGKTPSVLSSYASLTEVCGNRKPELPVQNKVKGPTDYII